jgi:hypothetical protein
MVCAWRRRLRGTGRQTGGRCGGLLYIHQRASSASRPVRQLKGFERLTLGPGAKETVHLALGKDELQFWSPPQKRWLWSLNSLTYE